MAQRILGMGDVLSLIEKAQAAVDVEDAAAMEKALRKDGFTEREDIEAFARALDDILAEHED